MPQRRIYLDNAATSWPKPQSVYDAVDHYQRSVGAPAGRSAYHEALEVAKTIQDVRRAAARLLSVDEPRRIVFTLNGTDALNIAIHGVVRAGDHVVTSEAEHNSVLRPIRYLEETQGVAVTRLECDETGCVAPQDVADAVRANTRLVALTHASNVTGTLQPLEEIGRMLQRQPALFLIDAAQTLGHVPVEIAKLHADLLAASGHKGLLGPLGTGILYVGPEAEPHITSLRQGGTGTHSDDDRQPSELPERLEAGNLNVPGIVGLAAGLEYICERGLEDIRRSEAYLVERLVAGFREIPRVTVYGPEDDHRRVGLVSIAVAAYDAQEVAAALDSGYGIQVRSGLHCAPKMHERLGTDGRGGAVRFSVGPFTMPQDIDHVVAAVSEIAAAPLPAL